MNRNCSDNHYSDFDGKLNAVTDRIETFITNDTSKSPKTFYFPIDDVRFT
jgi:hypothetical protein